MKVRSLLFGMLCMLALGASLVSCSDDDDDSLDDDGSKVTLPQTRVYILNEGSQGANNAGLAFYAPNKDADFISDIYKTQNNAKLGDLGQSMIEYEDEIYIAVYGSNYLTKLNAAGVELKRVSFVGDNDLSAGIRYIDAEDGYIYASFWGGAVAKINATTLEVVDKLTGLGDNLEGVTITEESSFKDDLGADSLDLFELVMAVEEEYGVEIPAEELEKLTTVGSVVEYLKAQGIEA